MKKKYSISIICVFLAVIVFFTSFSVFGKKRDFSVDENRALMTLPQPDIDSVLDGSFQSDYTEYLSDQFEWRSFFVTVKTNIMRTLGRQDLNGVYFGRDGYLIERYTPSDFDTDNIDYNEEALSAFTDYTTEKGINTVVAFVPSKAAVLSNRLPMNVKPYSTDYVVQDTLDLTAGVKTADLYKALREHNGEYIYYRTDHHWTSLGAYYAYAALSKPLGYRAESIDDFTKKTVSTDFSGSTFDKVQVNIPADEITVYDTRAKVSVDFNGEQEASDTLYYPEMLKEKNKYDYFLGGNFSMVTINTDAKSGKSLLIIKDSYTNSLVPYLCRNYSKIIMVDLRYYNDDVYELLDENSDLDSILVLYNTEKFMIDQNQDLLEPYEDEEEE